MINKRKGFTLIEIVVVVALMAILLVLGMTNAKKQKERARDNVRIADIGTIRLALEEYKLRCGQYPPKLELNAHSHTGPCTATSGITLGDFLPQIPEVPKYTEQYNYPSQGQKYFYYGTSSVVNGPCYDYIVGVQLEHGADNDFNGGENKAYFNEVDQPALGGFSSKYNKTCFGSLGNKITDADDGTYGIYGFRSTQN